MMVLTTGESRGFVSVCYLISILYILYVLSLFHFPKFHFVVVALNECCYCYNLSDIEENRAKRAKMCCFRPVLG